MPVSADRFSWLKNTNDFWLFSEAWSGLPAIDCGTLGSAKFGRSEDQVIARFAEGLVETFMDLQ